MADQSQDAPDIRTTFMAFVRPHLDTKAKKEAARAATGLELGTLDGMIYDGRGGIEAWQKLLTFVFNVSNKQLDAVLVEIKDLLRKRIKLTPGQLQWSKVGDELSDDERIFFSELAIAHKKLKPPFDIKQKKK